MEEKKREDKIFAHVGISYIVVLIVLVILLLISMYSLAAANQPDQSQLARIWDALISSVAFIAVLIGVLSAVYVLTHGIRTPEQRLRDWVVKTLKAGGKKQDIRRKLEELGWNAETIKSVLG